MCRHKEQWERREIWGPRCLGGEGHRGVVICWAPARTLRPLRGRRAYHAAAHHGSGRGGGGA